MRWAVNEVYNPRFTGPYFDPETGLNYNYFRDYDPTTGRYIESDPIGLNGGSYSTYTYVNDAPVSDWDETGEGPSGGPYHPPEGTGLKCTGDDGCAMLKGKMWVLMRMINSHQMWDWINPPPRGGGRHAKEIADLWRAYANCQALHAKKCEGNCPPSAPTTTVPAVTPAPVPLRTPVEPLVEPFFGVP
jgi:RHS repeat-associated protein